MSSQKNPQEKPLVGKVIETTNLAKAEEIAQNILPVLGDNKNRPNFFIGTLNITTAPFKALAKPLHRHYHKKYHSRYKHAKKIFALDLALVIGALGLAATVFFLFFAPPAKSYLNISLTDSTATVGANRDFKISVINNTTDNLSDIVLSFQIPKNIFIKEYPTNFDLPSASLKLGSLAKSATQEIIFKGQAWGALNETEKILIRGSFITAQNKKVEQLTTLDIPLTKTSLEVNWTLPEKIIVGRAFNIDINYQNNSGDMLSKAVIIPDFPKDLTILSGTKDLSQGRWVLQNIPAGKNEQIKITAYLNSLTASQNGWEKLTLQSFLEFNNQQNLQKTLLQNVPAADNGLSLQFKIDDKKTFFKPGETISLTLPYQNKTNKEIKDLVFTLTLPPILTSKQVTTVFSPKISLKPQEQGETKLTFTLAKDLKPGEELTPNFSLILRPSADWYFVDEPTILYRSFAEAQQFKISTFLKLHAESRYFTEEGDQLGRGPLPPRVGQTTKYWINLFVTTSPNSVKGVQLRATLAPGVSWTGKTIVTEGEPIKFDPITRTISWKNDLVEATGGDTCPCVGAGFELSITPSITDLGLTPKLLDQIYLSGTDIYTNEYLETGASPLTTSLTTDSYAKGKGQVRE
ncbi:MAG: hypothetical protein UT86_C0002G0009 [Candidatus Magasanikbacteria bacterium GW2011_GWC2_40_17]|uniref:DUF11 domain-containing protein n=1 Tax=Candidatus Magasanikbacteria bacterium GW2011_GWA2_42_32 TaxID=1619039 RepID=A0A0G1A7B4_9BACT|nr:MAG: hypothetical protein UT86_C0002G0009 [Candidatus Magasanikbacteria bacterium GW2011_GWC2_40_17]KKS56844.1 MAG: hypothetical protein UV20_C0005G0009 [Candidatus Magasanikbacteria bacterium GW2011_GWA2_42_32]